MRADERRRLAEERVTSRRRLPSAGRPLDAATRATMEAGFGHSFADVRVHTDERAGTSARALGARAYTVGRDIVFGPGELAPETPSGRRLLAHELAHVVQQRQAATAAAPSRIADPSGSAERAARRAGDAVASGAPAAAEDLRATTEPGVVHRQELAPTVRLTPSPTLAALLGSAIVDGFPLDGDRLSADQQRRVAEVGRQIVELLESYPGGSVSVVGHTDATGEEARNLGLGQRRADAAREALHEAGVPVELITAESKGESELRVPTAGPEARNRRVEIRFRPQPRLRFQPPVGLRFPQPHPEPEPLPMPSPGEETVEQRLNRILREPPPEPYKPPTFNQLFWRKVDDLLSPVLHAVPEQHRERARSLAHKAIRKGTTSGLEAALKDAGLDAKGTEAVVKTVETLLEEPE